MTGEGIPSFVLVVEDSPTQAERLRIVLEEAGFRVEVARNGAKALEKIRQRRPDAVVSDVMMPQMNGYQMCQAIKKDPHTRNLPVLLLTTLHDAAEVLEGMEAGADCYITKPYEDDLLTNKVRALIAVQPEVTEDPDGPLTVLHLGTEREVRASRRQLLNVLLSTYENAVRQNQALLEARNQLECLNEDLVREVAERRRAEEETRELNARLERSNEELAQFAYVASHDLKQPLTQIAQMVEMLSRSLGERLSDRDRKVMDFIGGGVRRLQDLIHDLLQLSQVDSRGADFAPVDLRTILDTTMEDLRSAADEAGGVVLWDKLPTVQGDRSQLARLFLNLVGNALKFRRPGEAPVVQIRAARNKEGLWHITVSDNGIGFPQDKADRIFGMFQRLHSDREYRGTGIGLAICAKIVANHGGRIWAESVEGSGSTFHFTLRPA